MANFDITDPLEKMGNVTDEVIRPAISGVEVTRLNMRIPDALKELAQGQEAFIGGIGKGLAGIAKGLGGGGGATQDMAREGALEGRASVTRDTNGDIQVLPTTTTLFGRDAGHYADAAYAGTVAAGQGQLRHDLTSLATANLGNPDALEKSVNGYLEGHLGGLGAGQAGRALLLDARDYGRQLIDHARTLKAATDIQISRSTLVNSIAADQNDLLTLAQGGASGSDEFVRTLVKQNARANELASNPAFGMTPEQAATERRTRAINIEGATIQGRMSSAFNGTGGVNAASAVIDSIDGRKDLTDADKLQLKAFGQAHLKQLQAGTADATAANKENLEAQTRLIESGKLPPDRMSENLQPIIDEAIRTGDTATASKANGLLRLAPVLKSHQGLAPQQIDQLHGAEIPTRPGVIPGQGDPHKPGFDPNAVEFKGKGRILGSNDAAAPPQLRLRSPSVDVRNVDPQLLEAVSAGATHLPPGYSVQVNEGYNPQGHVVMSQHHIAGRGALDIQIIGPNGPIPNKGDDSTGMYTQLATATYNELKSRHPDLEGRLAWGGNFGTVSGGNVRDLMHFDLGGDRGHLGRLSELASGKPATSMAGWKPTANDTRADKNFNPGNIAFGQWASAHGATGAAGVDVDHQVAVFANPEAGFAAMAALALEKYTSGKTTADQLIAGAAGWTPGNHNGAADIARRMGLGPNDDLRLTDPARMKAFQISLAIEEGAPRHVAAFRGYGGSSGGVVTSRGVGFTAQDFRDNPYLASQLVRITSGDAGNRTTTFNTMVAGAERGLSHQLPPQPQELAQIYQLATDDEGHVKPELQAQLDHLLDTVRGTQFGTAASGMPGGGQDLIDQAMVLANGGDIHTRDTAIAAQSARNAGAKELKDDPFGYAARQGWSPGVPAPINYADPNSIAQGIATRGRVAQMITGRTGQPQSALGGPDEGGATNVITSGTPQQKVALLGSVVNLPSPIREATLATIGAKGADGAVMAQAGQVALSNPDAAQEILHGQALLKAEPRFGPKEVDYMPGFAKLLPPMDLSAPDVRGRFLDATKAYYANQMAKAGKTDQVFDETLWATSLDAVTGGVLDHNGTKVIAPRYGETQPVFDEKMQGLTDADLAGARLKGSPFPASALAKPWFTSNAYHLVSRDTDAGTYFIMGGTKATPSVVGTGRFGPDGREIPFVLNLRNPRPAQQPNPPPG